MADVSNLVRLSDDSPRKSLASHMDVENVDAVKEEDDEISKRIVKPLLSFLSPRNQCSGCRVVPPKCGH